MFESLSDKLQSVFKRLSGKGRLTEEDVDEALKEVRRALLEADVSFKVVKAFVAKLRERAVGVDVLQSLTPAQQVIKIVNEELIELLGGGQSRLEQAPHPPTIVMLVGLQGSGKTTTAAKLGLNLRRNGQRPLLVAADVYRPAAVQQLISLGKQLDIPVHSEPPGIAPLQIVENAERRARELSANWLILDTAGRLHIDEAMMAEVSALRERFHPTEVLLVADAMTGQDAVRAAEEFNRATPLTGLVLTKMDGDARGGAALSVKHVTGVPIKFMGTGEKTDALEPFYPDRLASRILGMGDVLTLIEKAQASFDEKQARAMQEKFKKATFNLDDFLQQLQQVKKMGPLSQIMDMIPGFSSVSKQLPKEALDDRQLKRIEAIIQSMTMQERQNPQIINGSRRRRIARGSGVQPNEVNQLLNQFRSTQQMMKQFAGGKLPRGLGGLFR